MALASEIENKNVQTDDYCKIIKYTRIQEYCFALKDAQLVMENSQNMMEASQKIQTILDSYYVKEIRWKILSELFGL